MYRSITDIEKFAFNALRQYGVIIETDWLTGEIILTNPITEKTVRITRMTIEDLPFPFEQHFLNLLIQNCKKLSVSFGAFSKYNRTNHGSIIPKGGN